MEWQITDFMSYGELLAQAAEEAIELAHASLKLRRAMDNKNPTPVGVVDAVKNLNEEIADLRLCLDQLGCVHEGDIERIYKDKKARWISRLVEARQQEDERIERMKKASM